MTTRGMIATVGGSPEPVTFSLNGDKPSLVLFIVSEESRSLVEESILPKLEYETPQHQCWQVSNHENIETCYKEMRDGIAGWLDQRRISPREVRVDYTGGTKVMSAALALCAVEDFSEFKYIASYRRGKGGVGQGQSGFEHHARNQNPWNTYAVRDLERSNWLLENFHADAASEILKESAEKCRDEIKSHLETYAAIADILARADRFDFRNLTNSLRRYRASLQHFNYGLYRDLEPLEASWQSLRDQTKNIGETPGRETLLELLANAERRASQSRFDAAAARLYRVVELHGQILLKKEFDIELGKARLENFPEHIRQDVKKILGDQPEGGYKISLRKTYELLNLSRDEEVSSQSHVGETLKAHLEKRNNSILAHGSRPVSRDDYEKFWNAVLSALEIEDSDIPHWPKIELTLN